jgi:hypothetical protein
MSDDLTAMLGEDLGDFLDDLGDDVAPAQIEADAQNKAIILRRRKRALARHIRNNPDELGKFTIGGAFKSLGKGITAPMRIVGKVATGDFKGALKAAADPMGLKTLLRKGKNTVKDVRGAIHAPQKLVARAGAQLGFPAFPAGLKHPAPTIKAHCSPCKPDLALSKDLTTRVVPEMKRIQTLLGKMELNHKATAEHKRKKQDKAWRKEVLVLLKRIQQKRCA